MGVIMKIAICDDQKTDINIVLDTLREHTAFKNCEVLCFESAAELLKSFKQGMPFDIAFLDVDMPETNGINLGKQIKELRENTFIVFVSSYPQYAIEAFDCEAFSYLLKPLDKEKTNTVLNRLLQRYSNDNKYHIIKIRGETLRIAIKELYYIECFNKHLLYHLKNKSFDTVANLSDAYDSLKKNGFLQVHQGYIVNMDKISHFDKFSVILDDGRAVPISVRKRKEVLLAYADYIEVYS